MADFDFEQKKLEERIVAKLMRRFIGIYGAKTISNRFSLVQGGEDVGMSAAIEAFAIELYPLRDRLNLIAYGLEYVNAEHPKFPPTPFEFHQLCLRGKRQEFKPEPEHYAPASPEAVSKAKEAARGMNVGFASTGWAESLRKDWLEGKKLLVRQVEAASKALGEIWKTIDGKRVVL